MNEEGIMNKSKEFWISVAGLIAVLIGAIVFLLIDYPIGILLILPVAILNIVKLVNLKKEQQKAE